MLGLCGCPQASCSEWGLLSTWGVQVSHCGSFSCGAQALGAQASAVTRHGFSSCGTWAYLLCDMWDLPSTGREILIHCTTREVLNSSLGRWWFYFGKNLREKRPPCREKWGQKQAKSWLQFVSFFQDIPCHLCTTQGLVIGANEFFPFWLIQFMVDFYSTFLPS